MKQFYLSVIALCIGFLGFGQKYYPQSGNTYVVASGSSANLTDPVSLTLGPNTHIQSGATFTAKIVPEAAVVFPSYSNITLSDQNYVFTRSYQTAMSSPINTSGHLGDVIESVTYFDGLGRPMQQVGIRASKNYKDIITQIGYDDFGRQDKDWLPMEYTNGNLSTYRGDISGATNTFYRNKFPDDISSSTSQQNAYSQKEFEASPLNRVLKQGAPGNAWRLNNEDEQGVITFGYDTNANNEVRLYGVSLTSDYIPTLTGGSRYYDPGELYKTVTKDENHDGGTSKNHTTVEYTDKQGRVVLKRTYGDSDVDMNGTIGSNEQGIAHDTYYVYDDYGNLTYVLPPKSEATGGKPNGTELSELCYQYRYDTRNRLIEKKIPGKGKEYIVYNKLDQPCMTQDANLDAENKWLFTKYDAFGRVAYTGYWSGNETRANLQSVFDGAASQYETRQTTPKSGLSDQLYYDNIAKPIGVAGVYTINYYDTYLPNGAQGKVSVPSQTSYGVAITTNVKTLLTVSRVRVLTTNDWITTTTGYNKKGRAIWIRTVNEYLDTDDIVELKLDFTGKVEESKTVHTKTGQPTITTIDKYEYDHMGRLIKQSQKINDQSYELIAFNEYDELGQLKKKKVGNTDTKPLQEVDYTYNIRGWLKTINNPSSLGNDLFAFKLNYNTQDHGATTLFNGNISETEWRTANSDNSLKWYTYGYDALNRITYATDNLNRYALSSTTKPVSYDKNGNITSLLRKGHKVTNPLASNNGHFGTIDDLTYVYDSGNKLLKVTDAISLSSTVKGQFNDGNTSGNDYTYDANGNLIKDLNKGISSISYNHLNLPDAVNVTANKGDGTGTISYIYDATGIKLEKSVPGEVTQYAGNYTYKKVNNTTTLEFFNQSEGYVEKAGSRYKYVYQYKDHLGNVRLSYQDKNGDGDIDVTTNINTNEIVEEKNYYPFGLEHKGYNNGQSTEFNYKQFQGQEFTNDLGLNWHEWKYRISDPAIGRFISVDPLAEGYVYNGVYNFAENRVIDGNELEGLEWENFMSKFKDPKDLKVKRPSSNAQRQSYKVNTSNNSKTFKEVKSIFLNNPQDLLTNSKAEFNSPVDGNGNETSFQEGSFIEIDIDGPSNNAYVKVENITDTENNVSASFVTMEGHIEKGEISFSIKVNEDGTMSFSIESKSEVDQGIARTFAENFSRTEQKESWKEVLNNFVEITGGEEKDKNINVDN